MNNIYEIIEYKDGIIKFSEGLKQRNDIYSIWEKLREDYADWISKVITIEFKENTTVLDVLHWNEMPTWWINQLTSKDVAINNGWFKRLQVIYILKYFPKIKMVKTDDIILKKTINLNFTDVKVITTYTPCFEFIKIQCSKVFNILSLLNSLLDSIKKKILLIGQKVKFEKNLIWFRTGFPSNAENYSGDLIIDRHLKDTPLDDINHGLKSGYLVSLLSYQKDKELSVFELWVLIRSFEKKAKRKSIFIEAYLSIYDIIHVYYSTLVEFYKLLLLYKEKSYVNLFRFNDLDISLILLDNQRSSYFGFVQYNKLLSLSIVRFLESSKTSQTIVTYEELLPHTRFAYFDTKIKKKRHKFIAIQHTTRSKNKLFSYFRKSEFTINNKKFLSYGMPNPNFYFVHGLQYKNILSEFFQNDKIKILGCLRNEKLFELKKNKLQIKNKIKKKIYLGDFNNILLAPSLNDLEDMLSIIDKLNIYSDINIILRPHPATNKAHISEILNRTNSKLKLKIIENFSTYELICVSDLVICGNSTIPFEAAYFGVPSVRVLSKESFPLYESEKNDLIPYIHNSIDFLEWFSDFRQKKTSNLNLQKSLNELSNNYYYKIDGKVKERFWKNIKKLRENKQI